MNRWLVSAVGGNAFGAGVVEVTLVEPQLVAVIEPDERAATGEFEMAEADVFRARSLTNVDDVLP